MAFSAAIREFIALPDDSRRLGPYRCKALLDKAGAAPVFRAAEEHAGLALRDVAVKVFDIGRGDAAKRDKAAAGWQARVLDEARSLCRVQHPNVIRFHTLATDTRLGLMGLVMEFAEGVSVGQQLEAIERGSAKRIALAVEVGISISSALSAVHAAGLVHCNIKPSNIMFTDGAHKLINFGIAASLLSESGKGAPVKRAALELADLSPESVGRTASTLLEKPGGPPSETPIAGSIGYVDPSLLQTTSPPSASSDLYSLGATLYECLAGDVPAVATATLTGAKGIHVGVLSGQTPAAPLSDVASTIPADLAQLVDSMVAAKSDDRPRSAEAVLRSLERIRSSLAGHERALPPIERGPFPGLDRYDATDREVFFGRSAEIAGVIELARTRGLVGIVGLSGSGKSSLARAGVVPAIEDGALGGWPTKYRSVLVTPGASLMGALTTALERVLGESLPAEPEAIVQSLMADVDKTGEGLVILIDQLEEIVTRFNPKDAAARLSALDLLSRLADAPVGLRVIVAVRRDLLDGILAIEPQFSRALSRGIQLIGPLSAAAWEEVIDRSLEAYGYRFADEELRGKVMADLKGREAAMTLVQFALMRLWESRNSEEKTLRPTLDETRSIASTLERHAEATVAKLTAPRETLRDVLLMMTTPEGTRAHVEMDVLVERFGPTAKDIVFAMTKARLVIADTEGFTFVHDSILRDWGLLHRWIEDARGDRLLVAQVERDAKRWDEAKDSVELWRKGRLAAALELWKQGVTFSEAGRRFLTASARAAQRAEIARWGVVLVIVALLVGGSLFYAKLKSDSAAQARKDADALAAALAEVKTLKQQAEENAGEAEASAKLLHDLQQKILAERVAYNAQVTATMKKVASATSLDSAQKATEDLKASKPATNNQVIPLPTDVSGPGPSAQGVFDQGAIERVVNTRKAGVKRTCIDRGSGSSNTKVTATLTIAPSGAVQNVSASGNDPVVAKCIEQQLRSWSFPPPGEVKQVQIPFVFIRQ